MRPTRRAAQATVAKSRRESLRNPSSDRTTPSKRHSSLTPKKKTSVKKSWNLRQKSPHNDRKRQSSSRRAGISNNISDEDSEEVPSKKTKTVPVNKKNTTRKTGKQQSADEDDEVPKKKSKTGTKDKTQKSAESKERTRSSSRTKPSRSQASENLSSDEDERSCTDSEPEENGTSLQKAKPQNNKKASNVSRELQNLSKSAGKHESEKSDIRRSRRSLEIVLSDIGHSRPSRQSKSESRKKSLERDISSDDDDHGKLSRSTRVSRSRRSGEVNNVSNGVKSKDTNKQKTRVSRSRKTNESASEEDSSDVESYGNKNQRTSKCKKGSNNEREINLDDSGDDDVLCTGEENLYDSSDMDSETESETDEDDSDIVELSGKSSNVRVAESRGWNPRAEEATARRKVHELEMELLAERLKFSEETQKMEEKLKRLENEVDWKDQQLEELNELANKNVELEARVNLMLSGKEGYEEEVKKVKEAEGRKIKEAEEKKKKEEEEAEKAEEERKKKEEEKRKKEAEKDSDTEEGKSSKKKRRRSRKKKEEDDDGKDEIDAYFVDSDDGSDVQVIGESKSEPSEKPKEKQETVVEEKTEAKEDKKDSKENEEEDTPNKGRHVIRKLMAAKKLKEETKQAAKREKERIERMKKEHDKHLRVDEVHPKTKEPITKQLVLAFKQGTKTPLVEVNPKLIKKLKPHQVDAVEFLWDNVIESMDKIKEKSEGSGCLLAHCMGLGKTLTVITLVHTLLTTKAVGFKKCLVVCPLNTVLNWQYEWEKWLDKKDRLDVYELTSAKNNHERAEKLNIWRKEGGIMILGYSLFRILANYSGRSKRVKKILHESLTDPGADIVVCDEGHMLKNDASAISKAMNGIKTKRRIVLTGTPLQNNLVEYHCMVNFVKPDLLGSRREFSNRFVNPITNGQHSDSTQFDVKLMKRRAHILHSMLDGCVQRRDYSALIKFLPPKHEYVISVRLSELQIELYQKYLELNRPEATNLSSVVDRFKVKGAGLFADYQALMRIWTHPWVLKLDEIRQEKKPYTEDDDDELESLLYTSSDEEDDETSSQATTTSSDVETIELSSSEDESEPSDSKRRTSRRFTKEEADKSSFDSKTRSRRRAVSDDENEKKEMRIRLTPIDDKRFKERSTMSNRRDKRRGSDKTETETESELDSKRSRRTKEKERTKDCNKTNSGSKRDEKNSRKDDKCDLEKKATDKKGDSKKEDGKADDSKDSEGERKAKVIAGEVIKQWQSNSRGDGKDGDVSRRREDPWWLKFVTEETKTKLELSGKLVLMFQILTMAESIGDKVLVFSQSLLSLDLIEDFLALKNEEAEKSGKGKGKNKMSRWVKDEDYCRMDGSTLALNRRKLTTNFNDVKNPKMRLFLISTKAGGLGINLDSANRVIIFDASWNPSHDIQSIFRVYRFGQEKDVFIYRFLAQGTMEEKIYERQVTKETLSQRVIDEHQIDRHFTANDLRELYIFKPDKLDDPDKPSRPTPAIPKDLVLAELLSTHKDWIVQYHEHDSLLENRPDEDLSEEERKAAWEEYEREKRGIGGLYRHLSHFSGLIQGVPAAQGIMTGVVPASEYNTQGVMTGNVAPVAAGSATATTKPYVYRYFNKGGQPVVSGQPNPTSLSMQMSQLPRVVQEILKYNPTISSEDLTKRVQAFLGMHSKYNQVPGHAMGPQGSSNINLNLPSIPGISGSQLQAIQSLLKPITTPQIKSTAPLTSTTANTSQSIPVMVKAASVPSNLSNATFMGIPIINPPSRLPQPGLLPANKK